MPLRGACARCRGARCAPPRPPGRLARRPSSARRSVSGRRKRVVEPPLAQIARGVGQVVEAERRFRSARAPFQPAARPRAESPVIDQQETALRQRLRAVRAQRDRPLDAVAGMRGRRRRTARASARDSRGSRRRRAPALSRSPARADSSASSPVRPNDEAYSSTYSIARPDQTARDVGLPRADAFEARERLV